MCSEVPTPPFGQASQPDCHEQFTLRLAGHIDTCSWVCVYLIDARFICIRVFCSAVDSMSESENIRQPKVPRRAHVTLTQDSDVAEDSDSFVVVGHRVRKDVAEKSGLLSGLAQVDGLASLPDDLSPEDVQLWQSARLRGIFPSTDELVTIVKVSPCTDQLAMESICILDCHVVAVY